MLNDESITKLITDYFNKQFMTVDHDKFPNRPIDIFASLINMYYISFSQLASSEQQHIEGDFLTLMFFFF